MNEETIASSPDQPKESGQKDTLKPKDPRKFGFQLPAHGALAQDDRDGRWKRLHEQKRLKAYLGGKEMFAHGREPVAPFGFRSIMWPVNEPSNDVANG